jgi:hypothetical protein
MLAENLLKGLHREVMIAKFLIPINTIRRIIIAVPPKAEYEAGFQKWVEHFCRMGGTLGCRVHFFANEETTVQLQALVKKKYGQTLTDFSRLDDWVQTHQRYMVLNLFLMQLGSVMLIE